MTQYDDTVERQRLMLEAEEWAGKTKGVHAHSIDSMYYDDRPQDTAGMTKTVTDWEFNDGTVQNVVAEAKQTTAPSGTFVMYITDNSISQTVSSLAGVNDSKSSKDFAKEHKQEISSAEGKKELVEAGTSFGVDLGTESVSELR